MFEDHATWSTVNNALAAIAHEHHNAGLVPAHKNPSNLTAWKQLTRGYRRNISTVKTSTPKAKPLLRDDVFTMLTGRLLNRRGNAIACAGLVSLETGATAPELFGLRLSDLVETDGTIDGSREVGMPVFGTPTIYQLPGLAAERRSLRPEGVNQTQLARLRLAIAVRASDPTYYSLIRARAWMILSWPRGLRMGSDLTDLRRSDITVTDTHITLKLQITKDDGRGRKHVVCSSSPHAHGRSFVRRTVTSP